MGKPTGFKEYARDTIKTLPTQKRIRNYAEFSIPTSDEHFFSQAARCMDCGVPFCMSHHGCPLNNLVPEWNHLVYQERWQEALSRLHQTNNFPEITGRVCPAPCEGACVLGIIEPAVTIKNIEYQIAEKGFAEGWIKPTTKRTSTNKSIAIIGSGPSGLAAADQLNALGHSVTVFERADRIGGLLMYGIPAMKLDKSILERRLNIMAESGVEFRTNCNVGVNVSAEDILNSFDAVLLAVGSTIPRDINIPGRNLRGIHFAMDFLTEATKSLLNTSKPEEMSASCQIFAQNQHVVVIGGGDTGNDCIGTAIRQGCSSLVNFELLPKPPVARSHDNPWPEWPRIYRSDYGHKEAMSLFGKDPREFSTASKEFIGDDSGHVRAVRTIGVKWTKNNSQWHMEEIPETERVWETNLVFLALGFLGPEQTLITQFKLDQDPRGNILTKTNAYATSHPKIFATGDCRRGQSLVVWAINEGRQAAKEINASL